MYWFYNDLTICDAQHTELKLFDFEQMAFVIQQLSKAGYTKLYMPVRPEHIQLDGFQKLEHDTALRLLNQHIVIDEQGIKTDYLIELYKDDNAEDVKTFLQLVIEQLPKGHLAKPFRMDDGAFLHILDTGLYLIKEKRDEDGELKQTSTFICHSAIILGEARSLNNDNWKRVIQFHDKDNTLHRLLIPYEHFMGEAQEALKIIANHGRCFATPNKTYGSIEDEELLFHSDNKSPYTVSGSFEEWQKLSQLIEPHALAVLAFSSSFSGQLVAE